MNEMVNKAHWAVVENISVWHEGDERSRTHPGHGYPEHVTNHKEYKPFETHEEAIKYHLRQKNSIIIKANPFKLVLDARLEALK